eukprot:1142871-Pelagomonas_calceolata.AAC.2
MLVKSKEAPINPVTKRLHAPLFTHLCSNNRVLLGLNGANIGVARLVNTQANDSKKVIQPLVLLHSCQGQAFTGKQGATKDGMSDARGGKRDVKWPRDEQAMLLVVCEPVTILTANQRNRLK